MRRPALLLALAAVLLACSAHDPPGEREEPIERDIPPLGKYDPPAARAERPAPPPPPELVEPPLPRQPLLAGPPVGPAAYFRFEHGVFRLDDAGWVRIWDQPTRAIFRGLDGEVYLRDDAGLHRLRDDGLWLLLAFDDGYSLAGEGYSAAHELVVGPKGEIWVSATGRWKSPSAYDEGAAFGPARIDPDGTVMLWTDPNQTGIEQPRGWAVDGRGRAWFIVGEPTRPLGLLHKAPDSGWKRVQPWEINAAGYAVVDWAGADDGGLWLVTHTELMKVTGKGVGARAEIISSGALALNHRGRAVIRDPSCRLRSYALDQLDAAPIELGSLSACEGTWLHYDDLGRVWQTHPTGNTWVVEADGTQAALDVADEEFGELRQLVIPGPGPTLPAAVDGIIRPKILAKQEQQP